MRTARPTPLASPTAETPAGSVRLRRAAAADAPLLRRWDAEPHVMAAIGSDDADVDWDRELALDVPWMEILIGELDGRPVGVVQAIDPAAEATHYWGPVAPDLRALDIWIGAAADLGRGIGSAMMRLAIDRCFADPRVAAILIDPLASNRAAHRFYERLGFVKIDERVFETELCFVYRLERPQGLGGRPSDD